MRAPDLRIDPYNDQGELGTAAHEVLADVVNFNRDFALQTAIKAAADKYAVDLDELSFLVRNGVSMWLQLRQYFVEAMAEFDLAAEVVPGVTLTGHPDIYAVRSIRAATIDWKSGRVDRSYAEQVNGYSALILDNFPEVEVVDGYVCWLREKEFEHYSMDRERLAAWRSKLDREVVQWDEVYRPHSGCVYCQRSHECPALVAMAKRDLAIIGDASMADRLKNDLADLGAPEIVHLYRSTQRITSFAKSLGEATRRVIKLRGALDAGDGKELRLVETHRRNVDAFKAWPVLQARLSDEELASTLKVSIADVEDLVAKKAGKGNGAAAKRTLAAELELAQAVTVTPGAQLREVRKGPQE